MVDIIGPVALAAAAHARGLSRAEFQEWIDAHMAETLPATSLEAYDVLLTMEPYREPPVPNTNIIMNPNPEESPHD